MEHREEEEEEDTGSGADAAMDVSAIKHQALRLAEDLSLPSVQVVVMSANMGCSHCRQRVTKVVSKMNGLLDYMVDFGKKEVTVRGTTLHTSKVSRKHKNVMAKTPSSSLRPPPPDQSSRTMSWFLGCYSS